MIEVVRPFELEAVSALIQRVVLTSVDASDAEKEDYLEHIANNLGIWGAEPSSALHLKYTQAEGLVGVIMVKAFWNLCHLFVAPENHGQGIGRALVTAASAECWGRSAHEHLRVNSSRNAAGFYRRLGFTLVPDAPPQFAGYQYQLSFPNAEVARVGQGS